MTQRQPANDSQCSIQLYQDQIEELTKQNDNLINQINQSSFFSINDLNGRNNLYDETFETKTKHDMIEENIISAIFVCNISEIFSVVQSSITTTTYICERICVGFAVVTCDAADL